MRNKRCARAFNASKKGYINQWIATEMFLNEPYTAAVDVYALDVTAANVGGKTLAHKAPIVALARTPLKGLSPPLINIYTPGHEARIVATMWLSIAERLLEAKYGPEDGTAVKLPLEIRRSI